MNLTSELRNAAIEKAAQIVENDPSMYESDSKKLADKIRALKTKDGE